MECWSESSYPSRIFLMNLPKNQCQELILKIWSCSPSEVSIFNKNSFKFLKVVIKRINIYMSKNSDGTGNIIWAFWNFPIRRVIGPSLFMWCPSDQSISLFLVPSKWHGVYICMMQVGKHTASGWSTSADDRTAIRNWIK